MFLKKEFYKKKRRMSTIEEDKDVKVINTEQELEPRDEVEFYNKSGVSAVAEPVAHDILAQIQQKRDLDKIKAMAANIQVTTQEDLDRLMTAIQKAQEKLEQDPSKPVGLFDDLSQEDYTRAMDLAKERLEQMDAFDIVKNLERDMITVPKQKYCVVSWIGPTFKAKTELYGFRMMGAFPTLEQAQKYAQKINKVDPVYDIGVMEMNLWCLGYPDPSDIITGRDGSIDLVASQAKLDHTLNQFVIKHKTDIEEARQLFEVRKLAVRKSKITKEGNIEDAPLTEVPQGRPTEEMEKIHATEAAKWIEPIKQTLVSNDLEVISEVNKDLDYDCRYKVPNQEFAVVSYLGHTGKNKRIPICIKGVFSNITEAETHIKKLMQMDDTYDMLPTPLYKWVPCDPDISQIRQIFKDKKLNELLETEQNQKEEALQLHHAKITHGDLDEPLNPDYKGKGSLFIGEEHEAEVANATTLLQDTENDMIATYSFNPVLSDKDVTGPMFGKADEELRKFEEKIRDLALAEGISEEEARIRCRIEMKPIEIKTSEDPEDTVPIPKIKQNRVKFEEVIERNMGSIEEMKAQGLSNEEIRKVLSERSLINDLKSQGLSDSEIQKTLEENNLVAELKAQGLTNKEIQAHLKNLKAKETEEEAEAQRSVPTMEAEADKV
jgi:hypothetical protein